MKSRAQAHSRRMVFPLANPAKLLKIQGVFPITPLAGRRKSVTPALVDVCEPRSGIANFSENSSVSAFVKSCAVRVRGLREPGYQRGRTPICIPPGIGPFGTPLVLPHLENAHLCRFDKTVHGRCEIRRLRHTPQLNENSCRIRTRF